MFVVLDFHSVLLVDVIFNLDKKKVVGDVAQNDQLPLAATFLRDPV